MKAIGGYFELERGHGQEYYPHLLKLNTGRNCLEYLIRAVNFKKIYLPKFSCKVLLEPIKKLNIEYEYYSIDQNLNPVLSKHPKGDEVLLYINYFGLKDVSVRELNLKIQNLIVDNSQAFFSDSVSLLGTFYSARKFFGVPDGAYLLSSLNVKEELKRDFSWDRMRHLLKRFELGAESGYSDFRDNSLKLSNQPILQMSELTQSLLSQIDYSNAKQRREENFRYLHQQLSDMNQFEFSDSDVNGPMVYPLYVENENLRKQLIQNKIFIASYWPNVLEECPTNSLDYKLAKYILALPVDQRYSIEDMERICNVLLPVLEKKSSNKILNMTTPFVSVKTITYNHEKFIAQCIEGIMMQKTNFSFEYIIGEDCSTDGTMKIIQEYAAKYPDVIRIISDEKNVGAVENDNRTDRACKGKYVAFCEGDDFWTDPYKLQKQVDFLEANEQYGMVHSGFSCLNGDKLVEDVWKNKKIPQGDVLDDLISGNHIATATVCIRNEFLQKIRIANQIKENKWRMGDYPLWIEVSAQSQIAYMPDVTMCYRVHPNSATHGLDWNGDFKFFQSRYQIKNFYAEKYDRKKLTPFLDKMYHRELLKYAIFLKDKELRKSCVDYFKTKGSSKEFPYLIFSKYSFLDSIFQFVYSFRKRTQTLV